MRVLASSSIFGPRAASTRSSGGQRRGRRRRARRGTSAIWLQRLAVRPGLLDPVDQRRVADADAEEEAGAVLGGRARRGCAAVSSGVCIQRLRMPVATVVVVVAPSRFVDGAEHVAADVGDPQRRRSRAARARWPRRRTGPGRRSAAPSSRCRCRRGIVMAAACQLATATYDLHWAPWGPSDGGRRGRRPSASAGGTTSGATGSSTSSTRSSPTRSSATPAAGSDAESARPTRAGWPSSSACCPGPRRRSTTASSTATGVDPGHQQGHQPRDRRALDRHVADRPAHRRTAASPSTGWPRSPASSGPPERPTLPHHCGSGARTRADPPARSGEPSTAGELEADQRRGAGPA